MAFGWGFLSFILKKSSMLVIYLVITEIFDFDFLKTLNYSKMYSIQIILRSHQFEFQFGYLQSPKHSTIIHFPQKGLRVYELECVKIHKRPWHYSNTRLFSECKRLFWVIFHQTSGFPSPIETFASKWIALLWNNKWSLAYNQDAGLRIALALNLRIRPPGSSLILFYDLFMRVRKALEQASLKLLVRPRKEF